MKTKRYMPDVDEGTLLILASIAVHAEEATEPGAHYFDIDAIRGLIGNPSYKAFMGKIDPVLLPRKRSAR